MRILLLCLSVEMRKHLHLAFVRAYVSCALLALYVQGALPRQEPETFAQSYERRRPR